jgi:beta-phosphoglucomutase family hydrolase
MARLGEPREVSMAAVVISPDRFDAVIFDLDGVVTDTASMHAAAWTRLFDDFLAARSTQPGEDHRPFSAEDYRRFVDGKPRYDGVAAFLASRGIAADPATVHDLGDRKDRYFRELLAQQGVRVFRTTAALVRALAASGIRTAVISASRNCAAVLEAAGLADLFDVRVDGVVAEDLGLPGKPDPAVFLEAARRLGVHADRAVVVEDALAGVEAGRRGDFGLVIGVDRTGHPGELSEHGADVVVADLADVPVGDG